MSADCAFFLPYSFDDALRHLESMDRLLIRLANLEGDVSSVSNESGFAPSFSVNVAHLSVAADDGTKRLSQRFLPGYSLSLQHVMEDSAKQSQSGGDISRVQWKWLISRQKDRVRFQKKKLGF